MEKVERKLKVTKWVIDKAPDLANRYIKVYNKVVRKAEFLMRKVDPFWYDKDYHEMSAIVEEWTDKDSAFYQRVEEWHKDFDRISELIPKALPSTKAMDIIMNVLV
jgi:hypothetical protein